MSKLFGFRHKKCIYLCGTTLHRDAYNNDSSQTEQLLSEENNVNIRWVF